MPFERKKPALVLDDETREYLFKLSRSRTETAARVERAKVLLMFEDGKSIRAIAEEMGTNRPKVNRCVNRALELGAINALDDSPRPGRSRRITDSARAWVVSLACQKPKDLGYPEELWTTRLLAKHAREHCEREGHSSLRELSRGTVSKILRRSNTRPHKIRYYLERRDPEFDRKMAEVLHVYKEVEMLRDGTGDPESMVATLSYDEKPGIQAIGTTAPDLSPLPGVHPAIGRDYEYVRHGTVSLMAAIDLITGHVRGIVVDRHRSKEFVQFLQLLDQQYHPGIRIRLILDNHSAHISKETRTYLATVPNRFEFVFTPKHGSWLNIIESFFAKAVNTLLRGIRVSSKQELKARILRYLDDLNQAPVIFRWKYKMEETSP